MKVYREEACCPACHCSRVDTVYCRGVNCPSMEKSTPHIDRVCRQCSYAWAEKPFMALTPEEREDLFAITLIQSDIRKNPTVELFKKLHELEGKLYR